MSVEQMISLETLLRRKLFSTFLPALVAISIFGLLYFIFCVVPNEAVMGPVQRVFYFHVGSAFATYAMVGVILVGSGFYLVTKLEPWDTLAASAAPVGLTFASCVLASGSIWGHSAWNTWWQWEPRLVSFLVLWFILFSYILLRSFAGEHPRMKSFAAVLGILAAINVPIVIYSIKLLNEAQQLHPQVVARQGLRDARFWIGFIWSSLSLILLAVWLCVLELSGRLLEGRLLAAERMATTRRSARHG